TIASPQIGARQSLRQWFGELPFATPSSQSSPGSRNPLPHWRHPPQQCAGAGQSPSTRHASPTDVEQCGNVMIAPQVAVHASVPPSGKPSVSHVAPPKLGGAPPSPPGSHTSPAPTIPSPQTACSHPVVSKVQSGAHASVPSRKPSDSQVAPPRSAPSHSSPAWMPATVPQVSLHVHCAGVPGGRQTSLGIGHDAAEPSHSSRPSVTSFPHAGQIGMDGSWTSVNVGATVASGAIVASVRYANATVPDGSAERCASGPTSMRSWTVASKRPAKPCVPPSTLRTTLGSSATSHASMSRSPPTPSPRNASVRTCVPPTTRRRPLTARVAPARSPATRTIAPPSAPSAVIAPGPRVRSRPAAIVSLPPTAVDCRPAPTSTGPLTLTVPVPRISHVSPPEPLPAPPAADTVPCTRTFPPYSMHASP